jgi:hypothetical protein
MKRLLGPSSSPGAKISWLAAAVAGASASACSVDLSLGALVEDERSLVDEGGPSVATLEYDDAVAPVFLGPPDVTISFGGEPSPTGTGGIGDIDGDGFGDMANVVYDLATGTQYVHVRYGGPRPVGAAQAFEFGESGARLVFSNGGAPLHQIDSVVPAGDIDGDGFGDVLVTTMVCNGRGPADGIYLLYGGAERWTGLLDLPAHASHLAPRPPREQGGGCSGFTFAAGGDLDGDGFDDLALVNPVISSRTVDGTEGLYLIYGRAQRFAAEMLWRDAGVHVAGMPDPELLNLHVNAGGDIDGDGRSELLITHHLWVTGAAERRLLILRGSATRPSAGLDLLGIEPQLRNLEPAPLARALGDLDGDGYDDLLTYSEDGSAPLFYGSADLLSGPLEPSQAAAAPEVWGDFPVPLGDRDGDGDDELSSMRWVRDETKQAAGVSAATLSGTRTRLSGSVALAPPPTLADAQLYPDAPDRFVVDIMPAGDLDNDGAMDVFTRSTLQYPGDVYWEPGYLLHIHYGIKAPPALPEGPR